MASKECVLLVLRWGQFLNGVTLALLGYCFPNRIKILTLCLSITPFWKDIACFLVHKSIDEQEFYPKIGHIQSLTYTWLRWHMEHFELMIYEILHLNWYWNELRLLGLLNGVNLFFTWDRCEILWDRRWNIVVWNMFPKKDISHLESPVPVNVT